MANRSPWILAPFLALPFLAVAQPPEKPAEEQILFGDLPSIEAAALHSQTLAEAPAAVTVITAEQIRRYGYRTLAEALASVRGFYVTNDQMYRYVGVAGLSLPGDYNTRFLVMLNGHPLTNNIYNSNNFFGQDFGLDLDLVERIEIIRGPTSALYGSNGILANINVVTRSPVDGSRLLVASEADTSREAKLSASSSVYLGGGANLLVSASALYGSGSSFSLTGLQLPAGVVSPVDNTDGEKAYHTFANLIWHNWSFTAYWNSREKQVPVGLGTSLSGDPAQHVVDGRDFVGAAYKRQAGPGELQWQIFYDRYRYHDRFDYPVDAEVVAVSDINRGDWLNSQLTYALPVSRVGTLTAGVSGSWDLCAIQYNLVERSRQAYTNHPDRAAAVFAQQEWALSPQWKLYGGVRIDESRNFGRFISPRLAAVWQASPRTAYKLVYGRPFRNPSAFEQYYNDGGLSYAQAPPLRPEIAETYQASLERKVAAGWTLILDAFRYRIANSIEAATLAGGVQQYRNTAGLRTTGAELELSGKLWRDLEASAALSAQQAAGGTPLTWLANSPRQVAKFRVGAPFWRERVFLAGSWQFISARQAWSGDRLGGVLLTDATATFRLSARAHLQTGVRNLFDRRYEDPIYLASDRLRGDGRSAYLRLIWRVFE